MDKTDPSRDKVHNLNHCARAIFSELKPTTQINLIGIFAKLFNAIEELEKKSA